MYDTVETSFDLITFELKGLCLFGTMLNLKAKEYLVIIFVSQLTYILEHRA